MHKRRSYRILTVLAVFQPGGAHHQGPRQAHVDVQEMKLSITNAVRIMVSEDLRYKLMSIHVRGRQKDAGMAPAEPPRGVGEGGLASQLT